MLEGKIFGVISLGCDKNRVDTEKMLAMIKGKGYRLTDDPSQAHILIINMLRSCMQLDKIAYLIQYINGSVNDRSDDIIEDSVLYDYICKILDKLMSYEVCSLGSVRQEIEIVTADYKENISGARERLSQALEIIVVAYYASLIKRHSDAMIENLFGNKI